MHMTIPEGSAWAACRRPVVIAHRGACQQAPEDTLPAFLLARQIGADGIELDTKLTADGQVVILHDQTLERTTDGEGRVVERSLQELRRLDAGSHFAHAFAGVGLPTLGEVFAALDPDALINVEVANYATPTDRLPEATVELIRQHGVGRRVLISSFNPLALWKIGRLMPGLALGLLMTPMQPPWQRRLFPVLGPHGLWHPFETMITPRMVRASHRRGKWVMAWTVNDRARMEELVDWGVDGLITDVPDVGRQVADAAQAAC